ncbi:MAG: Tm-1-like ATP-binding domain-containing protein, partial [Anaerolineae bacterium]|nr:Tm-1-like ATP-binding domain-containing protein [Anaerolineae bacterium]
MGKNVVVIGTLDTKGPEIAYLRDRLHALGLTTTVVDSGILGEPLGITPDISRAEAAVYGGTTINALRNAGSRGKAVEEMLKGVRRLAVELFDAGKVHGVTS